MKTKGYLCGILASATWGTVFFVGRIVMSGGTVNPLVLAFWRCFFASLFLLFILGRRVTKVVPAIKESRVSFLFLSLTGIFLMNVLILTSLMHTTATSSSILMNANPVFILVLAAIFLKEKVTSCKILAVLLGFAGCVMVINGTTDGPASVGGNLLLGNFLAMGAALCWALYTVAGGNPTRKYGAVLTTFITLTAGMFLLMAVMLAGRINFWNVNPSVILAGAYLGIVPAGIGFTLWYNALKYIEAGELGIFQYLASVVTAVLAVAFLKESLTIPMVAGMILIFLSVYLPGFRSTAV